MTQWCQGCPGPVAEPHQCTFQLLPRHNEVLSWTYSTCSATRREHHTKSQRPETEEPYMARYLSYIYLSKLGRFRCRDSVIRCRVHWGQVRWMECSTSETQVTDGFWWFFFAIWNGNLPTSTLCKHCKHSTLGSPHPMPEKFSSCNVPSITYNTWQSFLHWCYTFDATNMKNSSHQGKTYKL